MHAAMSMLKTAKTLLLQSQESSQVFLSLLVFASKTLKWCENRLSSSSKHISDLQSSEAIFSVENVLLEVLMFVNAIFTNLENCAFLDDKEFRCGAEIFLSQFLDSFKIFCTSCQKNQSFEECQKIVHEVLSEALKVLVELRAKFTAACGERSFESLDCATLERVHIIRYAVSTFMDIGKFAALKGRDWVGMLNIAWKGVIALLQTMTRKDAMSRVLDIQQIIRTMIGCITESLKNAAESWSMALQEKDGTINVAEMKRLSIPVKFFLINVIRVVTHYTCQAVDAFDDILGCTLKIISVRFEMSKHLCLMFAAETIVETLEPSLFILLGTLFNSSEIKFQAKLHLLNGLLGIETQDGSFLSNDVDKGKLDGVNEQIARTCLGRRDVNSQLCRLVIFLGLLQSDCGDEMSHELAKRLDFPLQMICDAKIYPRMFELQVSSTQRPAKASWQCLYITLKQTLQMFFVSLAGTEAWAEAEEFLYRNMLHPHMLCRELILELWCFVSRHSEQNMIEEHIQDLLLVLSNLLNSSSVTSTDWPVRTIARLVCLLIKADPHYLATKVHEMAFGRDPFAASSTLELATALLRENFPIGVLPEELRSLFISSAKRALSELWIQVTQDSKESSEKLHLADKILCCLFESLYQENFKQCSDPEKLYELAKMSTDFLQVCQGNSDCKVRSQSLRYLSAIWQKIHPHKIKSIIVTLHNLILKTKLPESEERRMKISLAEALAGLGEVSMPEDDTDPTICALWELYHLILRERHWAYAHLALASFGYFVAHTSWNELWRFVPSDAALAHDGGTGRSAKESSFMSSLRQFLEKEVVCTTLHENDVKALQQEGELLEGALLEFNQFADKAHSKVAPGVVDCDRTDVEVHTDRVETSFPPEVNNAMRMLQEGMLLLKDKLPACGLQQHQRPLLHHQLSVLADVILTQMDELHQPGSESESESRLRKYKD